MDLTNIGLREMARELVDRLEITDAEIKDMENGTVPEGWTDTIMDLLENKYGLESNLREILTGTSA